MIRSRYILAFSLWIGSVTVGVLSAHAQRLENRGTTQRLRVEVMRGTIASVPLIVAESDAGRSARWEAQPSAAGLRVIGQSWAPGRKPGGFSQIVAIEAAESASIGPARIRFMPRRRAELSTPESELEIEVVVREPSPDNFPEAISLPSLDRRARSLASNLEFARGELVVFFEPLTPRARVTEVARRIGAGILGHDPRLNCYQLAVEARTPGEMEAEIRRTEAEPGVVFAVPHLFGRSTAIPNDPSWNNDAEIDEKSWAQVLLRLPQAWEISTGKSDVPIAIVDSGFAALHEDLPFNREASNLSHNWYTDHGTGVAALAAARGNNGAGLAGAMWNSDLRLYSCSAGPASDLVSNPVCWGKIAEAILAGARIINASLALDLHPALHSRASESELSADLERDLRGWRAAFEVAKAVPGGVLFVVGAGNDNLDFKWTSPAKLSLEMPNVLSVGSVNDSGERSVFSNCGGVSLYVPGGEDGWLHDVSLKKDNAPYCGAPWIPRLGKRIWTATPANAYTDSTGTSFAAPLAAGTAGLMLSANPALNADQLRQLMAASTRNLGESDQLGYPVLILDAAEAVRAASTHPVFAEITSSASRCVVWFPSSNCEMAVKWTSRGVSSAELWVQSQAGAREKILASGTEGTLEYADLTFSDPRQRLVLYDTGGRARRALTFLDLSIHWAEGGPLDSPGYGSLDVSPNPCTIVRKESPLCAVRISWRTRWGILPLRDIQVIAQDIGIGGPPIPFGVGPEGEGTAAWINGPPHRYRFTLYGTDDLDGRRVLDKIEVTGMSQEDLMKEPSWALLSPSTAPPEAFGDQELHGFAFASDTDQRRAILFGGQSNIHFLNETWDWNGMSWRRLPIPPQQAPPGRAGTAMAFDRQRRQMVLFGGQPGGPSMPLLSDTWIFDGTAWQRRSPRNSPPPRAFHAMAFDEARGRVVLHGGMGMPVPYGPSLGDTWTWDGNDWTQAVEAAGFPREAHAMAYDPIRKVVLAFGGLTRGTPSTPQGILTGTLDAWDGRTWESLKSPAVGPGTEDRGPEARHSHSMAWDVAGQQLLLFGGSGQASSLDDTWTWDGELWRPVFSASTPAARGGHGMVYDSARQQVLMFGGWSANTTWGWPGNRQPIPGWKVYVNNHSSNTVSVIDAASNSVTGSIPVGRGPGGIAVSPDGRKAFVTNYKEDTVSVIETASERVSRTIRVRPGPCSVVFTPDGRKAYSTNNNDRSVSVMDVTSETTIKNIAVGTNPCAVAMNPIGNRLYVANGGSATVTVIDTQTDSTVATIPVGDQPRWVAATPNGAKIYVASYGSHTVSVIDATRNVETRRLQVERGPSNIAMHPDGGKLYVTNSIFAMTLGTVSVIDTRTDSVTGIIRIPGLTPTLAAWNPDGTKAYVVHKGSPYALGDISVVSGANNTVTGSFGVGNDPGAVVFLPGGSRAYVSNRRSDNVTVIDAGKDEVIGTLRVGQEPVDMAIVAGQPLRP